MHLARRVLGVAVLTMAVVAAGLLGNVRPAAACSCAGVSESTLRFTGRAAERVELDDGRAVWRFEVTSADLGTAVGEVELVDTFDGSSCQSAVQPELGSTYRISAYGGENVEGDELYYAPGAGCGGSVELVRVVPLATADAQEPAPEPVLPETNDAAFNIATVLGIVVPSLLVVGIVTYMVKTRRLAEQARREVEALRAEVGEDPQHT